MASLSKGVALMLLVAAPAAARAEPIALVPHRAVYDLSLADSAGARMESATAMNGRMVFEFNGSACEGYTVNFRFVLETESAEGGTTVTDLRTSTFEEPTGYRFLSQTFTNEVLTEEVKGSATRSAEALEVATVEPEAATARFPAGAVFPTETLVRILDAARAGRTVLEESLFDGSETGRKLYRMTAVIGRAREAAPTGVEASVGDLARWPVSMSYFDAEGGGDQTPSYVIRFDLWENGVSTDLTMDYGDFALDAALIDYEALPATPCEE